MQPLPQEVGELVQFKLVGSFSDYSEHYVPFVDCDDLISEEVLAQTEQTTRAIIKSGYAKCVN